MERINAVVSSIIFGGILGVLNGMWIALFFSPEYMSDVPGIVAIILAGLFGFIEYKYPAKN